MSGFFLMRRGWQDHPAWQGEPFSRAQAWAWLIEEARWKPTRVSIAGKTVELQRGELSHSIRFLAARWGWGKGVVERFIARLKTETLIETRTETGQLVISICKYDEMQASPDEAETDGETDGETRAGQRQDGAGTNRNKRNQGKQGNHGNDLIAEFEIWYARYPRKVKPDKARAAYLKARKSADAEILLAGLDRYIREKPDYADWAHPTSWLNDKRWLDEPAAAFVATRPALDPLAKARVAAQDVIEGKRFLRQTLSPSDYRQAIAAGLFTVEQARAAGAAV